MEDKTVYIQKVIQHHVIQKNLQNQNV